MNISILTPDAEIFQGIVTSVKVPGTLGSFQVLKNHAPIVSSLSTGEVSIVKEGGEKMVFGIKGGFIEVLNNNISLLLTGVS
ncbi:MAG: ATP synthase F1 subunit epsilon [Saprospiraceae bacterium]